MLVLTRYAQQSIMIGNEVEVIVLSVRGDKVKLGIIAPRALVVDRTEIHDKKKQTACQRHSHNDTRMKERYHVV